jgi:uncharacterized membrane protein YGL010W
MSHAEDWLAAYDVGHNKLSNRVIHWVCSPVTVSSIVGLLWSLPTPEIFERSSDVLNWGSLFVMAAIVYYFIMSISLAIGVLPFLFALIVGILWIDRLDTPLWLISLACLGLASVGQFIGHMLEGGKGSLMRDLHYAAIAPLWTLAALYRRLGIPY